MRLRIGAMVLGFIGGMGGYVIGILALIAGAILPKTELGEFFRGEGFDIALIALFPIAVMGVIGAAITLARPRAAGILMLLSAIAMFFIGVAFGMSATEAFSIETMALWGLPASFSILLIIAGILALIARKEEI